MPLKKKKKEGIPKTPSQQRQPPPNAKVEGLPVDLWRTLFPLLHAAEVKQVVLSLGCQWVADLAVEDVHLRTRPRAFRGHIYGVLGCAFSPSGQYS